MNTLLEASEVQCVFLCGCGCVRACMCVCVSVPLRYTCASSWVLQTVLCARGPISGVWWVWSTLFPLSPCQYYWLALVFRVLLFTADISQRIKGDTQPWGEWWKQQRADQISEPSAPHLSKVSLKQKGVTSPGPKAASTPAAVGSRAWDVRKTSGH